MRALRVPFAAKWYQVQGKFGRRMLTLTFGSEDVSLLEIFGGKAMWNSDLLSPRSLILLCALFALGVQIKLHMTDLSEFVVQQMVEQSVRQSDLAETKLAAFKFLIGADSSTGNSAALDQQAVNPRH